MSKQTTHRMISALVGIGVVCAAAGAGWVLYARSQGNPAASPSRPASVQAPAATAPVEDKARQRAEALKARLGLTDEQTDAVAEVFARQNAMGGDFRNRWNVVQEELRAILTPEQMARMESGRARAKTAEPSNAKINSVDIDKLKKAAMTPEQKELLQKKLEEWQQEQQPDATSAPDPAAAPQAPTPPQP